MNKFKSVFLCVVVAATATTAVAQEHINHVDRIQMKNAYDSSSSGTVPGVQVTVDGERTLYQVGKAPGLTRDIVFDETGKKAVEWAQAELGVKVKAVMCPGGGGENEPREGKSFVNC